MENIFTLLDKFEELDTDLSNIISINNSSKKNQEEEQDHDLTTDPDDYYNHILNLASF